MPQYQFARDREGWIGFLENAKQIFETYGDMTSLGFIGHPTRRPICVDTLLGSAISAASLPVLRVLPVTHKVGVVSDDAIHELAAKVSPLDCVVPMGGILAMRPLIVHASSKSQSENSRRVLHIEYAASEVTADGLELAVA